MKEKALVFRTPEPLKWIFVGFLLLPIAMMSRNAFILLQGENDGLTEERGELISEVAKLKQSNFALGETVDGLEVALEEAKVENERLVVVKNELTEEMASVRVQLGYHESREDSLQRVIDLLKTEIVAKERKIDGLKRETMIAAKAFRRISGVDVAEFGNGPEMAEQNYFELVKANELLKQQADANDRQALDLLTEISKLNTELEHFKSSKKELKGEVATLKQELHEKRALIDAIAVRESQ